MVTCQSPHKDVFLFEKPAFSFEIFFIGREMFFVCFVSFVEKNKSSTLLQPRSGLALAAPTGRMVAADDADVPACCGEDFVGPARFSLGLRDVC